MKKKVLLFTIFLVFLISIGQIVLADEYSNETAAYDCLLNKVEGTKCSTLSNNVEAQIFSLWATKECKSQVLSASSTEKDCWPKGSCTIEMTAKALISLSEVGENVGKIKSWLLARTKTTDGLNWFLQVDSNEETTCTITYSGGTYSFTLGLDKKIKNPSPSSGSCFSLYRENYWLKIDDGTCLENEFTIKCAAGFTTNLIYQEKDNTNAPYYISITTNKAIANEETTEKINSLCFRAGSSCDYVGSLWATLALDYTDSDNIASFLPYLISKAQTSDNDYQKYIPDAFVYQLREYPEYRTSLLAKQSPAGYWDKSNNKYYDTALALLPFSGETLTQKTKAKEWLISHQRSSGCFGDSADNIRDTAFILLSIWPRDNLGPECEKNSDCLGDDEKCLYGKCVPDDADCVYDRHCPNGVCEDYKCVDCRYDDDCDEGYNCDSDTNECYKLTECSSTHPCPAGEQCIGGYCMAGFPECTGDEECTNGTKEYCVGNICVECRLTSNCEQDYICSAGSCIDDSDACTNDNDCVSGYFCDLGECIEETSQSCTSAGYFCRSRSMCLNDGGSLLEQYSASCSGVDWCCDQGEEQETCDDKDGEVCSSNEDCDAGQIDSSVYGLGYGEVCCIDGSCVPSITPEFSDCELINNGECRTSCLSNEIETYDEPCLDILDKCCVSSSSSSSGGGEAKSGKLWLWILIVLIILAVVGIIFREKLQLWFMQFTSGSKERSGPRGPPPGFPPFSTGPPTMMRRPLPPRRILPPSSLLRPSPPRSPPPRAPQIKNSPGTKEKPKGELDDVIKKLKEIGK